MIAERHPQPFITWITRPEAVDLVRLIRGVDEVIPFTADALARVGADEWDFVYSLSNDLASASLATIAARTGPLIGYSIHRGALHASNDSATRWLEMGSFDRLKRENRDSYQRIMLDIIGHDGPVLPPVLLLSADATARAEDRVASNFPGSTRSRVAGGIGAGDRWPKKMLDAEHIARYARALRSRLDVDILLVGGATETRKAESILPRCDADGRVGVALTPSSIQEFVALLQQVDALLCGDTLALHVATAIGLPTVCVFGPTSEAEIPDFNGLIAKVSVKGLGCLGCYGDCSRTSNCMSLLMEEDLVDLTHRQLMRPERSSAGRSLIAHSPS
jgi:ADP-heptose:LPS heptosyltransferase